MRRGVFALALACTSSLALVLWSLSHRAQTAAARMSSAAEQLESLTDIDPVDDARRAAVAWGYAQRLRLGLESPFRLVESAARDPRLSADERRTVSWALLAHMTGGRMYRVDPATLDGIGVGRGREAGESHLGLIARAVDAAPDPRSGELGVRLAYTLATHERLVEHSALTVVAGVAALLADREIAIREAHAILRASRDPVAEVAERRARLALYVERPSVLAWSERHERDAVEIAGWLLDSLRALSSFTAPDSAEVAEAEDPELSRGLFDAGAAMPPTAPLVVTVRRHLPQLRAQLSRAEAAALEKARNAEMLAAVLARGGETRVQRKLLGRLAVSTAVAARAHAQEPTWFPGDSSGSASEVAAAIGVAGIRFDADVPRAWRPYFLKQLALGMTDLRRVLPALHAAPVRIRFRMTSPSDSALAMHDPRTRTLHLPVLTAAGTLTHELAHELDRQVAVVQGHAGYRSDFVTRNGAREKSRRVASTVSASLRALTEELPDASSRAAERPAEVFATQVDWFVARALASRGISNGFLTAAQDELLTGHVVHPDRLRTGTRTRPLLDALRHMTVVAPFAAAEQEPTLQALVRFTLSGPIDRGVATRILADDAPAWAPPRLEGAGASCASEPGPRATLLRMAAESRARGWLRLRARWGSDRERASWARSLHGGPWSGEAAEVRTRELRDHILTELSAGAVLPAGLAAHAAPLAAQARCAS